MSQDGNIKTTIFQKFEKFGDLFIINLLVVISSVPIITIGAAFTAMYSYTTKLVKDQEGPVWKSYWSAFRKNFKPATKAWLVILLILAIMYIEYVISFSTSGLGLALILGVMAIESVFLSFTIPLLFPLIARYENTTMNYIKNSFILSISNLGSWFYLFFLWVIPVALYASSEKILYYTWPLWLVLLIALLAYASSMVVVKLYNKVENSEESSAEVKEDEEIEDSRKITKHLIDTSQADEEENNKETDNNEVTEEEK